MHYFKMLGRLMWFFSFFFDHYVLPQIHIFGFSFWASFFGQKEETTRNVSVRQARPGVKYFSFLKNLCCGVSGKVWHINLNSKLIEFRVTKN